MPIHEYTCTGCRAEFEELVRGEESIECPVCHEARVERRFSTFATSNTAKGSADSPASTPGGCGTCGDPRGPGACQL
jgi:putative FmdB family regulatory protein